MPDLIAPRAVAWLKATTQPRLLQAHRNVWNLINEHGDVLALLTPAVGMQPFGWLVTTARLAFLRPAAPLAVDREACMLQVGQTMMVAAQAQSWQPRPAWQKLDRRPLPAPDLSLLPARARAGLVQLVDGVAQAQATTIEAGTLALAGYGYGLTPTGDDLLVGVLHALHVWRAEVAAISTAAIATLAAPRTSALSAAFLRCAAAGEAAAVWHALADDAPGALARLLATGARSGREAWAGFCYAGRMLRD